MPLDKKILNKYNATRNILRRKYLCNAPFSNMYFNIHGDSAPCWLSFNNPESYPDKSIKEIWFGKKFNELRHNIKTLNIKDSCKICYANLLTNNFVSVLAKAYDLNYKTGKYPVVMELELDNTCNLECIMCDGNLSSAIRVNREKKPLKKSPYDDAFVNQLNEFIPHLKEVRFNGGEPFLSKFFYQICDNILQLNPKLKIVVATNGTQWNEKIEKLLNRSNISINFSIDSLKKTTYEQIRKNADFNQVMDNLHKFHRYCISRQSTFCILINPMRQNWEEMPDFVNFCNDLNIPLWFNTIQHPSEVALWSLESEEILKIIDSLSLHKVLSSEKKLQSFHNVKVYNNFVNIQLKNWYNDSISRKKTFIQDITNPEEYFYSALNNYLQKTGGNAHSQDKQVTAINTTLNHLITQSSHLITKENLYSKLNNIPIEIIITELTTRSTEDLLAQLKKII